MLCKHSRRVRRFPTYEIMKISTKISLAVVGLIVFAGTPTIAFAQQDKGGVNEATETQKAEAGSVTKTHESNTKQDNAKKKKKPQSKAGKVGVHNKELMKELSKEMNDYTNNQARLKRGREVAEKKNDKALGKKCKDLQPKVEAKHKEEMAKLHKKYGEKEVNAAIEVLENERKRGKSGKVNRSGTSKKKKQNKRNKGGDNDGDHKGEDGDGEGDGESSEGGENHDDRS